ncbi:protease inhibitor I42 family protein [Paratractidigestivibacter sp.]|uniref:protease inhibitor I42 family protein n=1 Tax=Paratractidigestivibacter sp. TaxID=2847316 RepID=UPI002ABDB4A9|nr:protease inhibitor I42 family protein [Paratractidigestivibacter sp.]
MKKPTSKLIALPLAVLVAFVAVIGLGACSSSTPLQGQFGTDNAEFEISQEMIVARLNNTSADTDWNYTITGEGGLQCEGDEISEGKDCSGNTTEGVVSSHAFRFSATGAGEQTVTFTYGNDSAKTITLKVVTGDKGALKSVSATDANGDVCGDLARK